VEEEAVASPHTDAATAPPEGERSATRGREGGRCTATAAPEGERGSAAVGDEGDGGEEGARRNRVEARCAAEGEGLGAPQTLTSYLYRATPMLLGPRPFF